jgi:hypothetical protein
LIAPAVAYEGGNGCHLLIGQLAGERRHSGFRTSHQDLADYGTLVGQEGVSDQSRANRSLPFPTMADGTGLKIKGRSLRDEGS